MENGSTVEDGKKIYISVSMRNKFPSRSICEYISYILSKTLSRSVFTVVFCSPLCASRVFHSLVPSIKTLMGEGSASQVVPLLAVSNCVAVWERNIFQLCIFKAMKRGGLAVWRAAEQFFESAPLPPILLRSSSSSYHENISIRATQTRPHSLPVVLAHSTVVRQHLACWNDSTKGFLLRYPADAVFG